jgi:hypothetical protein
VNTCSQLTTPNTSTDRKFSLSGDKHICLPPELRKLYKTTNVTFIYIFSYFISFFKYIRIKIINLENTEWAIKNGQLATYGTQDEEKQKKNTT